MREGPNPSTCPRCRTVVPPGPLELEGDGPRVRQPFAPHECRPYSGHLGVRLPCSICGVERDSTELTPVTIGTQRRHLCSAHEAALSTWWYAQTLEAAATAPELEGARP